MKTSIAAFALLACVPTLSAAPDAPPPSAFDQEVLAAHNAVRASVHVPPLVWSERLASQALDWARYLARTRSFEHSPGWMREGEGENILFWGGMQFTPEDMVGVWSHERVWYHGGPFSPDEGPRAIGHYTQIIWRGTTEVGCGLASAPDEDYGELDYFVCRYAPPGNVIGEPPY